MTLLYPKPPKREKKHKAMKRKGEKTDAWEKTRADLKVRFERTGIVQCELGYGGCWKDNALSFAHSKKRRYITSQEELEEVCLCCTHCHQIAEYSPNMYEIVRSVIARRKVKV